jgi:ABC-type Zn uptake system ZnuABC Zn-binding protein ZnuA
MGFKLFMKTNVIFVGLLLIIASVILMGCAAQPPVQSGGFKVLAVENFLADVAQNVAGNRVKIDSLIPIGLDPHSFEPTPQDVARIADCDVLIVNGAGVESWLNSVLDNAGGKRIVVVASMGLKSRTPRIGELVEINDPHFWLDPTKMVTYVENIRIGLSQADPEGASQYSKNAAAYKLKLADLDQWILDQVSQIPPQKRLLVTNHETFGYYADRYGFMVVGTVIPSVSTDASPSAQQMAQLIDLIRKSGAPAIFLETGANPQLADQIVKETGIKIFTNLFTHSITGPGGDAPSYLEMMRFDTKVIVEGLK